MGTRKWRSTVLQAVVAVAAALGSTELPTSGQAVAANDEAVTAHHIETVLDHPLGRLAVFDGRVFFPSRAGDLGWELWRSNGGRRGTALLKDVRPGRASSFPTGLTATGDFLFFFAEGAPRRTDLWKTDGTRSGTVRVKRDVGSIARNAGAAAVHDRLFFFGNDRDGVPSLWTSDGTSAGTFILRRKIAPGWAAHPDKAAEMATVGDTLFFTANDDVHGVALWKSNGRPRGTQLVKDISPSGPYDGGHEPNQLTEVDGTLFLVADDGKHGWELWESDGSRTGTVMVKDIRPGPGRGSYPTDLTEFGGKLFFAAENTSGRELWKSDGTSAGTVLAANIAADTDETRSSSPWSLTVLGGSLFFVASDGTGGFELWRSNGTALGTVELTDLNSDSCTSETCSRLRDLYASGDSVYFMVIPPDSEASGDALWLSDGTRVGTTPVETFSPMPSGERSFGDLTDLAGTLLLTARAGVSREWLLKMVGGPPTRPSCQGIPATITGFETINGTRHGDVIVGSTGSDVIYGRGGADLICGREGDDIELGGQGNDSLDLRDGVSGNDTGNGGRGTDTAVADAGDVVTNVP